ncbi:acetyl-CoA carboxylase biotin carboxylase subunit [Photobacterium sp. SDRW27]|uniref:acetyl/propionyl/methylcrotonyl-CoA carboxylase subunit alpha n=1 Tax=Photobacterium obscurum TaxID=2829490 RepID=UPI002242E609|nr:acetyl-CoA carboxylase biotin carboxylase subunit [Photobacterium obscurum]MCW8329299.1 acetyl-CoA carboxylase biotin carboxylase subunit [Photobacterium obscurum]
MSKPTDKAVVPISNDTLAEANPAPHLPQKISRLLIANRGEIACRVIDTAKKMGIQTIAVYSEADREAKHVAMADHATLIGPAPARDSYLNIPRIIDAALKLEADAIHPGYGFLSENALFSEACLENNIIFLGPSADSMRAMSSKSEAKTIMERAEVPLVPGYHGGDNSLEKLLSEASQIGYPVLLKAALGGGGKGMRIVSSAQEMPQAIASAKREASAAFGNDLLLIEKYITSPRHIEVQIFADRLGHTIYLSDRDCSIQRRHQKIIEEAPAPNLSDDLRQAMGQAAVNAAKAIGYIGAGTVEFLLDHSGQFYFMEMNTRLQVEHPVTELITGQDLVEWQINIAEGYPLPFRQQEINHQGHAIEVRIYAEDPKHDFLPASGPIHFLNEPNCDIDNTQVKVRTDSGIQQGDIVTPFYDPMLSKLIVWGKSRNQAVAQLTQSLADYLLIGPETNIGYLQQIISHPDFKSAALDTHFIERNQEQLEKDSSPVMHLQLKASEKDTIAIPRLALFAALSALHSPAPLRSWRLNQPAYQNIQVMLLENGQLQGGRYHFRFQSSKSVSSESETQLSGFRQFSLNQVEIDNLVFNIKPLDFRLVTEPLGDNPKESAYHCQVESEAIRESFTMIDCHGEAHIFFQRWHHSFYIGNQHHLQHINHDSENRAIAPLNGIVTALFCQPGEHVSKGQSLLMIEAMKMEYTVKAPVDGTISEVLFSLGDQVEHGEQLIRFDGNLGGQDNEYPQASHDC